MIHHYNHETVVLVLFTVPLYHFLFSRYLELAEHHFLSDILVPFPDSGVLYSRAFLVLYFSEHCPIRKATPHSSQTTQFAQLLQITVFFFPLGSFVCFICVSGFNKLLGISVAFLPGLIQVCW